MFLGKQNFLTLRGDHSNNKERVEALEGIPVKRQIKQSTVLVFIVTPKWFVYTLFLFL